MNKEEIEEYLGITDNEDIRYKNKIVKQFKSLIKRMKNITSDINILLKEDYGIYDSGKVICSYKDLIVYSKM